MGYSYPLLLRFISFESSYCLWKDVWVLIFQSLTSPIVIDLWLLSYTKREESKRYLYGSICIGVYNFRCISSTGIQLLSIDGSFRYTYEDSLFKYTCLIPNRWDGIQVPVGSLRFVVWWCWVYENSLSSRNQHESYTKGIGVYNSI